MNPFLSACKRGDEIYVRENIDKVAEKTRRVGFLLALREGNEAIVEDNFAYVPQSRAFATKAVQYASLHSNHTLVSRLARRGEGSSLPDMRKVLRSDINEAQHILDTCKVTNEITHAAMENDDVLRIVVDNLKKDFFLKQVESMPKLRKPKSSRRRRFGDTGRGGWTLAGSGITKEDIDLRKERAKKIERVRIERRRVKREREERKRIANSGPLVFAERENEFVTLFLLPNPGEYYKHIGKTAVIYRYRHDFIKLVKSLGRNPNNVQILKDKIHTPSKYTVMYNLGTMIMKDVKKLYGWLIRDGKKVVNIIYMTRYYEWPSSVKVVREYNKIIGKLEPKRWGRVSGYIDLVKSNSIQSSLATLAVVRNLRSEPSLHTGLDDFYKHIINEQIKQQ